MDLATLSAFAHLDAQIANPIYRISTRQRTPSPPKGKYRYDPTHVPRPPNCYMIFKNDYIACLRMILPSRGTNFDKKAQEAWNQMKRNDASPELKQILRHYQQLGVQAALEHKERYPDYVYRPQRKENKKSCVKRSLMERTASPSPSASSSSIVGTPVPPSPHVTNNDYLQPPPAYWPQPRQQRTLCPTVNYETSYRPYPPYVPPPKKQTTSSPSSQWYNGTPWSGTSTNPSSNLQDEDWQKLESVLFTNSSIANANPCQDLSSSQEAIPPNSEQNILGLLLPESGFCWDGEQVREWTPAPDTLIGAGIVTKDGVEDTSMFENLSSFGAHDVTRFPMVEGDYESLIDQRSDIPIVETNRSAEKVEKSMFRQSFTLGRVQSFDWSNILTN